MKTESAVVQQIRSINQDAGIARSQKAEGWFQGRRVSVCAVENRDSAPAHFLTRFVVATVVALAWWLR